jgi:putative ABC transport system ATP-binding protein
LGKGDVNINEKSLSDGGLSIVEVSNVGKIYVLGSLEIPVLSNVNLNIEKEEFLAIMGPSSSGKSTLVNLVGCLDRPTEGRVLVRGRNLNRMLDQILARLRRLEIGFVFQTFNLVPRLTAFENVLLPTFANSRISIYLKRLANELLEIMGLRDRMHHRPGELSGGQSQRISIARALINYLRSFLRMSRQETLTPEQEPNPSNIYEFEYGWKNSNRYTRPQGCGIYG